MRSFSFIPGERDLGIGDFPARPALHPLDWFASLTCNQRQSVLLRFGPTNVMQDKRSRSPQRFNRTKNCEGTPDFSREPEIHLCFNRIDEAVLFTASSRNPLSARLIATTVGVQQLLGIVRVQPYLAPSVELYRAAQIGKQRLVSF